MDKARSVEDYIAALPDWQRKAASDLRSAILAASPQLAEAIKWAQPVFSAGGPVCYFKAHKAHITFGFWRGVRLMELTPRLETSGEAMAHMKITPEWAPDAALIARLTRAAVELNHTLGDPTARREKP
jgi:hypothetical protein